MDHPPLSFETTTPTQAKPKCPDSIDIGNFSTGSIDIGYELVEKRVDDKRGRHLVATEAIEKGQLLFIERPLLSLQSIGNSHSGALVCRCCRAFIGGPDLALGIASGEIQREHAFEEYQNIRRRQGVYNTNEKSCTFIDDSMDTLDSGELLVPCRNRCGELFCSKACEKLMWSCCGHNLLCTGLISDDDEKSKDENDNNDGDQIEDSGMHPLLQYKVHAVQNNEALLMVGDLISTVVSLRQQQLECVVKGQTKREFDSSGMVLDQGHPPLSLEDLIRPYLDFTLVPWWEVVIESISSEREAQDNQDVSALDQSLRRVCHDSAQLLKKAILSTTISCCNDEEGGSYRRLLEQAVEEFAEKYDLFSGLFFGKIIGSFEQNAMGIRARHPLCRDVLEDACLRKRCHREIVKCIELAGMIEGDESDNDDDDNSGDEVSSDDFTESDITTFIANLYIDEHGSTKIDEFNDEKGDIGDDLDAIFTPLDGTAMFYTTCKMNHSCSPNTLVKYSYSSSPGDCEARWGSNFPLVLQCIALRDIAENEELSISYINPNESIEERQKALSEYGFVCTCEKCISDLDNSSTNISAKESDSENDLFGTDSDEECDIFEPIVNEDDEESMPSSDKGMLCETSEHDPLSAMAHMLDGSSELSICRTPPTVFAPSIAFAIQVGNRALNDLGGKRSNSNMAEIDLINVLKRILRCLQKKDFAEIMRRGINPERNLLKALHDLGQWPSTAYREAYWCVGLSLALGFAHQSNFLPAMQLLDKLCIFGCPRERIVKMVTYVGSFAFHAYNFHGLSKRDRSYLVGEYHQDGAFHEIVSLNESRIEEVSTMSQRSFSDVYDSTSTPVVIRKFAETWKALERWNDLDYFIKQCGNRVVPIERGVMIGGEGMKESLMTITQFIETYMVPSSVHGRWSLKDSPCEVAYLAQHELLKQIPSLMNDVEIPSLLPSGATHVNAWIGTGGTRTPLHFDSYDNILVQIVGVKYVRLYHQRETSKLYVLDKSKTSHGKQGNMSELNCEEEDFSKHPLAKDAKYTDALLFPGDCLYIPAHHWHYVRSLTTSASVNYWF